MWNIASLGVFLVLLALKGVEGQSDCNVRVGLCFQTWQSATQSGSSAAATTCPASEQFVACALREIGIAPCDLFAAADIKSNVNGFIRAFSTGSFQCDFKNASNPALQLSPCETGLNTCSDNIFKDFPNLQENCIAYDTFFRCTQTNLSSCAPDVVTFVNSYTANETRRLDAFPTFCAGRRQGFDIEGSSNKYFECLQKNILSNSGRTRDDNCRSYQAAKTCVDGVIANAYPPQAETFKVGFQQESQIYTGSPNFCNAANPCIEEFKVCNASLAAQTDLSFPCSLLDNYNFCVREIQNQAQTCDQTYYPATQNAVTVYRTEVDFRYSCTKPGSTVVTTAAPSAQAGPCSERARACFNNFNSAVSRSSGNQTLTCQAADQFVSCTLTAIQSGVCDIVAAADIKGQLRPFVNFYRTQPNLLCPLSSANSPLMQFDQCTENLVVCSDLSFAAGSSVTIKEQCGNYTTYVACTDTQLTSCSSAVIAVVKEYVANATRQYTGPTYYCDERGQYNIDAAEANFTACMNTLQNGFNTATNRDEHCNVYRQTAACVERAKTIASPRQQPRFQLDFEAFSRPSVLSPFYCNADNPCYERIKECFKVNADTIISPQQPCTQLAVYDVCLISLREVCEPGYFSAAESTVASVKRQIDQQHGCTPATTTLPPPTTTATTATAEKIPLLLFSIGHSTEQPALTTTTTTKSPPQLFLLGSSTSQPTTTTTTTTTKPTTTTTTQTTTTTTPTTTTTKPTTMTTTTTATTITPIPTTTTPATTSSVRQTTTPTPPTPTPPTAITTQKQAATPKDLPTTTPPSTTTATTTTTTTTAKPYATPSPGTTTTTTPTRTTTATTTTTSTARPATPRLPVPEVPAARGDASQYSGAELSRPSIRFTLIVSLGVVAAVFKLC